MTRMKAALALLLAGTLAGCGDDTEAGTGGGGGGAASSATSTTAASTTSSSTTTTTATSGSSTSSTGTGGGGNGLQTEHGGMELAEWMKLYWTWFLGGDQPGFEQDRIFLPLPNGTDPDMDGIFTGEMDVTIPADSGFVWPLFGWVGETYEGGDPPDDEPSMPPSSVFTGMDVVVTLDGQNILDSSVDDLNAYYYDAIDFDQTIPYEMPTDYGAIGAIWVKGIGVLHVPLEPGTHVLHLEEMNPTLMLGFSNTWNITVE